MREGTRDRGVVRLDRWAERQGANENDAIDLFIRGVASDTPSMERIPMERICKCETEE